MSMIETMKPVGTATRAPRKSLAMLRISALVTLASTLGQPVLAGMFLQHNVAALSVHAANGGILHLLQLLQLIAAWLYWRPAGGRLWPLLASAVLWILAGIQFGSGEGANLSMHVPLGVAIVLLQGAFTIWVCRSGAARPGTSEAGT